MNNAIYLDHAATTPLRPEAREAMARGFEIWANPSSPHAAGRAARAALEDARERIKVALGWQGEVILTSGASEALAIGLGRAKADRRLISAVEHDSVFRAAPNAEVLPIAFDWTIDRDQLAIKLRSGPKAVVAIQHVNSETGAIQEIDELAKQVREGGGVLISDCSQSAGKFPLPDADLIVVSAHKLGGPIGIGALLLRDFALLEPSGGQERGYRAGTENLPAALGFAAAVEACAVPPKVVGEWREASWLGVPTVACRELMQATERVGGRVQIVPTMLQDFSILSVTMPRVSAVAQLIQFDAAGFAVSTGSACSSGTLKPSRTLLAFGIDEYDARTTIRMSAGWNTHAEDLIAFSECWEEIAMKAIRSA